MGSFATASHATSPPTVTVPEAYNAAVDFVDRHLALGRGAKVAFRDDTTALTYAELAEQVARAGNALAAIGVRAEQRVLLVLTDSVAFPVAFFGAIKLGAVPVPVSTMLTPDDYAYVLRDSRAAAAIVSHEIHDRVAPALEALASPPPVVVEGAPPGEHAARPAWGDLLARARPTLDAAPTVKDDVAFWLYTSGSTGQPKAAVHLQSDLVQTAELYGVGVLGIEESDVVFSAAKLFFAYGLGNAMTFPLRVGATAVLMRERPTPAAVIARLTPPDVAYAPTVFGCVPTLYASLLASTALPPKEALRLRRCISAGEALPAEVGRRWAARTGCDILDGIGSTEMLHIFVSNRPGAVRYGTTGRVVPGYAAKIVDDDGHPVAPGAAGHLWVSGPSSAVAYWNKRALSLATFHGPWTRTGDQYLQDDDGYFVYQGRSDDMLKVGGIYVAPFEVESALASHEAVIEAAVVGHADEHGLVKPKAFVVLHPAITASDDLVVTLQLHVKTRLAPYKYPRWIEFVRDLPKTATGKIQRFKLRQR